MVYSSVYGTYSIHGVYSLWYMIAYIVYVVIEYMVLYIYICTYKLWFLESLSVLGLRTRL